MESAVPILLNWMRVVAFAALRLFKADSSLGQGSEEVRMEKQYADSEMKWEHS